MNHTDHGGPMNSDHGMDNLGALLLTLILGALATLLLLSILGTQSVVSASPSGGAFTGPTCGTCAAVAATAVHVSKTVEPSHLDTGQAVSICFAISGPGPRSDVVLALDISSSMVTQTRLAALQRAASAFVSLLPDTDRIAVVPYSSTASLAQPLTMNKNVVTRTIYDLTAASVGDRTNTGEAIQVAHEELITSTRYESDTVKTIILLSDGIANCDEYGYCNDDSTTVRRAADYVKSRAALAASDAITIYTIGFGDTVSGTLMQEIADISGGRYFYAPDGDALEDVYRTIASQLRNLIITDILTPGVETDCSQLPGAWCTTSSGGVTTFTIPISDDLWIPDPAFVCFTATANLDPGYEGPVNFPDSGYCYRDADGPTCTGFNVPTVTVGGRKAVIYLPIVARNYACLSIPTIVNGGFEDGWTGWIPGGELTQTIISTIRYSGDFSALLGDPGYVCQNGVPVGSAWMEVEGGLCVPYTDYPRLSFRFKYVTQDTNPYLADGFDSLDVRIIESNGKNVEAFRFARTTGTYGCAPQEREDFGWQRGEIDLRDYRGKSIRIRFENRNSPDGWFNTWTFVDDVRFMP